MGIITVTLNSGCHTEQDSAFMMTLSILNESLPFRTDHCHSERITVILNGVKNLIPITNMNKTEI